MKYIVEIFDGIPIILGENVQFEIEENERISIESNGPEGSSQVLTSSSNKILDKIKFHSLSKVISAIYNSFSNQFEKEIRLGKNLSALELEFTLQLNKGLGLYVISFEGNLGAKIKLKWDFGNDK